MITVSEASRRIATAVNLLDAETVPLADASGRVLRSPVIAERDQPPFDRVTMDGIAVRWDGARLRFAIAARQHAGEAPRAIGADGNCVEIMTGAALPADADTVIPVEALDISDGHATVTDPEQSTGQFIHERGSDHRAGAEILADRSPIGACEVAILASAGLARVRVARRPTVAILSTGDELVPAGNPIADHEVRLSNGPALEALIERHGARSTGQRHAADDPKQLAGAVTTALETSDVLLLTGGVSRGRKDHVPAVLTDCGVSEIFHRVSQRPGKPLWFGTGPRGQLVFGLPGNPVSTLVQARRFVVPALEASMGLQRSPRSIRLAAPLEIGAKLTAYVPVRLTSGVEGLVAEPVATNTSGDFTALGGTDGFVELPRDMTVFDTLTGFAYYPW